MVKLCEICWKPLVKSKDKWVCPVHDMQADEVEE